MNDLEKRAKHHRAHQKGLSPFCSLGESGYKSGDHYYGELPAEPNYQGRGKDARYYKELTQYFKTTVAEYPEYNIIGCSPERIILITPDGKETIDLKKFDACADSEEAIEMASHYFNHDLFESLDNNQLIDFNFTKELMYEVEDYLYKNPDTRRVCGELDMLNDHTFGILIENGDWKHEHIYLDHVVSEYLSSKGLDFEYFTKQVGTSDSDCYSAWHYYSLNGFEGPMKYDVEGDDETAAKEAQETANRLFTPVECRGVVYAPKLKLQETNKKKPYDSFQKDAGNVEHNVAMFNHMNNPAESPSTNPNGPMAESLYSKEEIDLEYNNLEFSIGDYEDEVDLCIDYTYSVDKDELYTYIFEDCIKEEDFPEAFDDEFDPNSDSDWMKFTDWLDDHYDEIFEKYKIDILCHYEDAAIDEAAENYDPDDYIDWDMMPGGHDYFD